MKTDQGESLSRTLTSTGPHLALVPFSSLIDWVPGVNVEYETGKAADE